MKKKKPDATIVVFGVGSDVLIGSVTSAKIISVSIETGNVIGYKCVWWADDGTRHVEWLEEWEVRSDHEKTRRTRVDMIL